MSKIETEGFISKESENCKTHFITKYKDAFQFYRNLNKYVMLFLNKLSIKWDDQYIELVEIHDLFGISAEKIGEYIVSKINGPAPVSIER